MDKTDNKVTLDNFIINNRYFVLNLIIQQIQLTVLVWNVLCKPHL